MSAKELNITSKNLMQAIQSGDKKLPGFTILKGRDFNWKKQTGLLVVKPENILLFLKYSWKHCVVLYALTTKDLNLIVFVIGGGSTRHLVGFTLY